MKCPHCKRIISEVSHLHSRMETLIDSSLFPDDVQDIGAEAIRKLSHMERFVVSLVELAYRRGRDGKMEQMINYEDENGNIIRGALEGLISSMEK